MEEGLDETLTRHRLGVFPELGRRFKTTNLIETVNAELERKSLEVDHRRTSDQKQRWGAAALLAVEQQFRRVNGYAQLPLLARVLMTNITSSTTAAA